MFRNLSLILLAFVGNTCPAKQPNVLFIAIDDLKPTLACYGDEVAITPNIDRMARRGTVFLNAHCQWPVCGPSRASIMTSLRPEANGVMNLKTSMRAKNPDVLTLPQHFRNCGYITAGAGKIYDPRCVDNRKTADAPSWSVPFIMPKAPKKVDDDKRFAGAPNVDDADLIDGRIAADGLKLMRRLGRSGQPFFLAVGFKKPHLPFVAPKKYWGLYQQKHFPLAAYRGGIENASGYSIHDSPEFRGYGGIPKDGTISDDLQQEAIHGYYACTSYVDAQVGLLLSELDRLNLTDNTLIVLWGDHGFHLGDHNMWGKHSTLEQATRVPLIICPPRGDKNEGISPPDDDRNALVASSTTLKSTSTPVEFTDVFPTLCDLAELEIPRNIAGRSLKPVIESNVTSVRDGALTVFKAKGAIGYSYRSERYRYTEWISNKFDKIAAAELYDYDTDPNETKNLVEDKQYAAIRKKLATAMRGEGQGCETLLLSQPIGISSETQSRKVGTVTKEDE